MTIVCEFRLGTAARSVLPFDRPVTEAGGAERHRVAVSAEPVNRLSREWDCTPWDVCLAAYAAILVRYGNDPVVLSVADRAVRQVVIRPEPDASFGSLLNAVRGTADTNDVAAQTTAGRPGHPDMGLVHLAVDAPHVHLDVSASVFDLPTAERMAEHLGRMLAAMLTGRDTRVGPVPMLADEERRVLREWTGTTGRPHETHLVHEIIAQRAAAAPGATAMLFGDRRLSYGELERHANRLAHHLLGLGVGPERAVAIWLEPSLESAIAPLAVMKAGGAYLPLDADYPPARLAHVVSDSSAPVLLTSRSRLADVPALSDTAVVAVDAVDAPWERLPEAAPDVRVDPADLAYLIYTSGSTGTPKGVMVEHRSLLNLVGWHNSAYPISSGDRATLIAGSGFDAAVWELWPYLAAGASVAVAPAGIRRDPDALCSWLHEVGATIGFVPTPLIGRLLDTPGGRRLPLRVVLTGGDRLTRYPDATWGPRLVNHYGPTECTVVATSAPVPAVPGGTPPSIGRPITNTTVHVLDGWGGPAPIGVPGELLIGGACVARGYVNDPKLTAERFVPGPGPAGRLYRTGDVVRWNAAGELEFVGRVDHQVKIRGHRIECGEIEALLRTHPAVLEAVVMARERHGGEPSLVAYVVPPPDAAPTGAVLRSMLREAVPDWMLPSAFVVLPELPLTANGKVDRGALPEPVIERDLGGTPSTPAERALAGIWADLLGLDRIGVEDNFFDLGGDSVLAMRLVAQARALGVAIDLRAVFSTDNLAELAADASVPSGARTADARGGSR